MLDPRPRPLPRPPVGEGGRFPGGPAALSMILGLVILILKIMILNNVDSDDVSVVDKTYQKVWGLHRCSLLSAKPLIPPLPSEQCWSIVIISIIIINYNHDHQSFTCIKLSGNCVFSTKRLPNCANSSGYFTWSVILWIFLKNVTFWYSIFSSHIFVKKCKHLLSAVAEFCKLHVW